MWLFPICHINDYANSTVSCIIDQTTRQWRADLVDGLFVAEDAELIKAIPLSQAKAEDVLFWPYTNNGVYSYCAPPQLDSWAQPNLGSQLTCMVGLSFLLRVILDRNFMRSLFSLSPPDFFHPPNSSLSLIFIAD